MKCIMLQGTGSSVGKSLLTAALCRIFYQDGYKTVPFKSQNMALNSYITNEGKEMGRAQVMQAEACGREPSVLMNPILLKPTTHQQSQVIFMGDVLENMSAVRYHEFKPQLSEKIRQVYLELESQNDIVVIEGAGSPAEINLKDNDIVNMGMAKIADAPVILVGDIDRGGVFASIAGTMMLLDDDERARVRGVIINKFRGDVNILLPGIKMLEDIIKIPVLGIVPHIQLDIDQEDGAGEDFSYSKSTSGEILVQIVKLPHISNFTDFLALDTQPDVKVQYIEKAYQITNPDIFIIPGTKNTIGDMLFLRNEGFEQKISELSRQGVLIFGICGGYQMLGKSIRDPHMVETGLNCVEGLGLMDMDTEFQKQKTREKVSATVISGQDSIFDTLFAGTEQFDLQGYEIHMGTSTYGQRCVAVIKINQRTGKGTEIYDGYRNIEGNVMGTYIHGIFDNLEFLRTLLNNIRQRKGMCSLAPQYISLKQYKESQYDKLADTFRQNVDMKAIYNILEKKD